MVSDRCCFVYELYSIRSNKHTRIAAYRNQAMAQSVHRQCNQRRDGQYFIVPMPAYFVDSMNVGYVTVSSLNEPIKPLHWGILFDKPRKDAFDSDEIRYVND